MSCCCTGIPVVPLRKSVLYASTAAAFLILKIMDFDKIWQPLYRHGSSDRYKAEAAALWARLTPDQQQHIYVTITAKLAAGRWLQFDPVRAISEHIPPAKPSRPEPKNYQGRALPAGKTVVSARYNGAWGFYELEEAEAHGMEVRYPEYIFTTDRRVYDLVNNHADWVQVSVPYKTDDFIFCTRANAEKYHLKILADPRNPA